MSQFGGPGARAPMSKPTPPERGSFPLDHEGECRHLMTRYLRCLKQHRGDNDAECRETAKGYLQCRMDANLMAPDEMRNLGFGTGEARAEEGFRTPRRDGDAVPGAARGG